jgi:alpha-L-fucosidase
MYHSRVDPYNIVDATPFKRDVIAELAGACARHGLKLGLYYSQDLDWHEPDGGGYKHGHTNCGVMSWTNDWDYPENVKKNYTACFERKIKPQVAEILQNYGELCLIWFDTPLTISPEQSTELYQLVKRYQPGCLINSRIGNGMGDYRSWGDNQIPDEYMPEGLYETPATLNDTWGYKSFDQNWKIAAEVLRLKEHLNARGINYLLNVGPDYLGRIPAPSQEILRTVGRELGK